MQARKQIGDTAGPVFTAPFTYNFAALRALILREFAYMAPRIDPPSSMLKMTAADLKALDAMLVIEAEGQLVACMGATLKPGLLYVGRLAVDRNFRGQGLARRLMAAAEAMARAKELTKIELGSRVELVENHAVFAALGFHKVREESHPGYDRPTSFWFRKELP